jgi:hypothetical protein
MLVESQVSEPNRIEPGAVSQLGRPCADIFGTGSGNTDRARKFSRAREFARACGQCRSYVVGLLQQ